MALIECHVCGKQVSDKAKTCPNCGEELINDPPIELLKCEECGSDIPSDSKNCPNCGFPVPEPQEPIVAQKVEVTKVSMPVDKNKIKKVVGILIGVVAIIAIILIIVSASKASQAKKAIANYSSNLDLCISTMFIGAADAESASGLIHDVWYNCIYEERDPSTDKYTRANKGSGSFYDDFNEALAVLFTDSSFTARTDSIESNQDLVASLMKELKNPPEEYADAYDALKDLYDAYCEITECAVNPSGNLSSYTSTFNEADSNFLKYYKAVSLYQ